MAQGFTVTSVNQSQELGPTGNLQDTVTVQFELDDNQGSGEVTVPLTADWAAAAEAAVQAQAAAMIALLNL